MAIKLGDYKTQVHNDWCPGCGDFGIVNAIQMSLTEMQIPRHKRPFSLELAVQVKHLILSTYMEFTLFMVEF